MTSPSAAYLQASPNIKKAATDCLREPDSSRNDARSFWNGYIAALIEHELVSYEEGLSLRDELSLAFGGGSIRKSVERGREFQERYDRENGIHPK